MDAATLDIPPLKTPALSYPQGAKGDRQALVQMQRVLWARVQDASVPPHIQAQCARAWKDLQDMKRIIDGKPLPGHLRPELDSKHSRRKSRLTPLSQYSDAIPITAEPAVKQIQQSSGIAEPAGSGEPEAAKA